MIYIGPKATKYLAHGAKSITAPIHPSEQRDTIFQFFKYESLLLFERK